MVTCIVVVAVQVSMQTHLARMPFYRLICVTNVKLTSWRGSSYVQDVIQYVKYAYICKKNKIYKID